MAFLRVSHSGLHHSFSRLRVHSWGFCICPADASFVEDNGLTEAGYLSLL